VCGGGGGGGGGGRGAPAAGVEEADAVIFNQLP
jgi:hypothetical protein